MLKNIKTFGLGVACGAAAAVFYFKKIREPSDKQLAEHKVEDIYNRMRHLICKIETDKSKSTGFLIHNSGQVLTVMHSCVMDNTEDGEVVIKAAQMRVVLQNEKFTPTFSNGMKAKECYMMDALSLAIGKESNQELLNKITCLDLVPPEVEIKEGMKVYFAGFPLNQNHITFHEGRISSLKRHPEDNGLLSFTIDGTVVPGNSGGPVVLEHKGELYIAGLIRSQVTDLEKGFSKLNAALNQARPTLPTSEDEPVTIDRPSPLEPISGNVNSVTLHMLSLITSTLNNQISTGIGEALYIRNIKDRRTGFEAFLEDSEGVTSVGKKQKKDSPSTDRNLIKNGYRIIEPKDNTPGVVIARHQAKHSPLFHFSSLHGGGRFPSFKTDETVDLANALVKACPFLQKKPTNPDEKLSKPAIYVHELKGFLIENTINCLKNRSKKEPVVQIKIAPEYDKDNNWWYIHFHPLFKNNDNLKDATRYSP